MSIFKKKRKQTVLEKAIEKAVDLAIQAQEYVAPYVGEAKEIVTPYVENAKERALPIVETAVKSGKEKAVEMQERFNEEVLPVIKDRASDARETLLKEGAVALIQKKPAPKKRCKKGKFFLLSTLAAAAAGIGYILWRRSQPLEDPWAEEYWEELNREETCDNAEGCCGGQKDAEDN